MRIEEALGPRSLADVFSETVRIRVGQDVYVLPVLPIRENREWKGSMEAVMIGFLADAAREGDDQGAVLTALARDPAPLLDLLVSYDRSGVLPPRDVLEATMTDVGLIVAVMEVWRAANPLVDTGLAWIETGPPDQSDTPEPMSGPPPTTDGRPDASRPN